MASNNLYSRYIPPKKRKAEDARIEEVNHDMAKEPFSGIHPMWSPGRPKPWKAVQKHAPPACPGQPTHASPITPTQFTDLGIPQHVSDALNTAGFDHVLPIQNALIPHLLNRRNQGDILLSAPTGSGKTLAFVLPLVSDLSRTTLTRLRGLIVVPTRDLVLQAYNTCEICATAFSSRGRRRLKIGVAYGDVPYKQERDSLLVTRKIINPTEVAIRNGRKDRRWNSTPYHTLVGETSLSEDENSSKPLNLVQNNTIRVDILICTPGRLVQHLHNTNGFELSYVNYLVIDEADRLFTQEYQGWVEDVMASLNKIPERRIKKILSSATVTQDLSIPTSINLKKPILVSLDRVQDIGNRSGPEIMDRYLLPETLEEYYIKLKHHADKPLELMHLLTSQNMLDDLNSEKRGILVFTNSNESALRLGRLMKLMDPTISICTITSTIPAYERKRTLSDFQMKKFAVLVASDLVSRGLDIPALAHVVNYDVPTTIERYVHRVGRTARAGNSGKAWTLLVAGDHPMGSARLITLPNKEDSAKERYEEALALLAKEAALWK